MGVRRNRKKIDPSRLHPKMAEGLTQGKHSLREARELPDPEGPKTAAEALRHLTAVPNVDGLRVPVARFRGEDALDSVWTDETDRLQRNVHLTFPPETIRAIREGRICLRCHEPQDEAFPIVCQSPPEMGCTYPIRERQIMDFTMEFEGDKHLGPSKPIGEYLAEQELRREQELFKERQQNGGRGVRVTQKIKSPGVQRLEREPKKVILP